MATMVADMTPYEALTLAVERAGSMSELARICEVSPTAVWKWVQSSKRMSADKGRVLRVESVLGISRHVLRPDIYPVEMPKPPRWSGVDQRAGIRANRVDSRAHRVAFNTDQKANGATA